MKRIKRWIALLVAIVLCLSLTGCSMLDEMRAHHGFVQEDGSLLLGKTVYRLLPHCEELHVDGEDADTYYFTTPDVPVLLSEMFGGYYISGFDGMLMKDLNTDAAYCREAEYADICGRITAGSNMTEYGFECSYYDVDTGSWVWDWYTLTPEQKAAVDWVYENVPAQKLQDGVALQSDGSILLFATSSDQLFRKEAVFLEKAGTTYYLNDSNSFRNEVLYQVPETMQSTFDAIFAVYDEKGKGYL